jgi:hypothetical protein
MAEKNMAQYTVGVHNVGSYQASGIPWITGSVLGASVEHIVKFPTVTKSVTVINSDSNSTDLYVYFASTGSGDSDAGLGHGGAKDYGSPVGGKHYITLTDQNSSITMNVRCKEMFIQSTGENGAYQVFAELTNIPRHRMWSLSGSGINEYYKGSVLNGEGDSRSEYDDDGR